MTQIILIAAVARNGIIGREGGIPWKIKEDLQFFMRTTKGFPTIMGRRTYQSIGKALPERPAIVVTSDPHNVKAPDATLVVNPDLALEYVEKFYNPEKVFIIGGEQIYKHFLKIADTLILTMVDRDYFGDTLFPQVEDGKFTNTDFTLTSSEPQTKDEGSGKTLNYSFNTYVRKIAVKR